MARPIRKPSRLEDRLAELDRELKHVRKSIRAVEKGEAPLPAAPVPPARRAAPAPPAASAPAAAPPPPPDDLFSLAARRAPPPAAGPGTAAADAPPGGYPAQGMERDRFGRYFTSGSLISDRPLRQERRVLRNKALFMVFVVGVVAFIVLSMIFF
jgi:hypothetical protein